MIQWLKCFFGTNIMFLSSLFKQILSSLLLLYVMITSERFLQVGLLPQALEIDGKSKIHRKANYVFDLYFKDELQVKYSVLQLLLRQAVCESPLPLQSDNHAVRIPCKGVIQWYVASVPAFFVGCSTWWLVSHILYGLSSCSCEKTVFAMLLLLHKHSECFITTGAQRCQRSGVFTTLFTFEKYYILRMYFALLG